MRLFFTVLLGDPDRLETQIDLSGKARPRDHAILLTRMAPIPIFREPHGSTPFDRAVLSAASASSYAPATSNCLPTSGVYALRIDARRTGSTTTTP